MTDKKEKEKQGKRAFSDSAEMFDTLFRAELTDEKQGEEKPTVEEKALSDSEELFVSAFKEEIAPQSSSAAKTAPPPQARTPVREPLKSPTSPAPAAARAKPADDSPSPGAGSTLAATPEKSVRSRKPPRSLGKSLKIIVPVLGVLVLAGVALFVWGTPDFFSGQEKPQPSMAPEKKELPQPPSSPKPVSKEEPRPDSPPSETKTREEPALTSAPPKPEVKEEPSAQPPLKPATEKPAVREGEPPAEQPAVEVAVETPEAAGPDRKALATKAPSLPYSVFLGSFKDLEGVQKAVSAFQKTGISAYWFPIDLGEKGIWYRIFSGCFKTREEAEAFIQEKRIPDASSRQTPHAALAGVYRTPEELETVIARLVKLGYGPYVIRQEDGSSYLYVGAYFQKAQAEALVAELAGKGIQSRPAER